MKYEIKLTHKGETIEVKHNPVVPCLYISGKPVALSPSAHVFLSNKQVVCRIYDALLTEIKNTPKGHFKSLKFGDLVNTLTLIVSTEAFLNNLRDLNIDKGYSTLKEKIREELGLAVYSAINIDYKHYDKFSDPQNWVLKNVSNGHTGRSIDTYELNSLYDPIKDDDSKLSAKVAEFNTYPFIDYISHSNLDLIVKSIDAAHTEVKTSIELYRKMRDIAGNDAVNWGPHKWASQVKKHNIKDVGYTAKNWLLGDMRDHLLAKGVAPKLHSKSSVAKLKEKNDSELTQDDLVKLFKNSSVNDSDKYIKDMTPAIAVSLLGMTTKNVIDKLYSTYGYADRGSLTYRPLKGLEAIINNVASGSNPIEFDTLQEFLKAHDMQGLGTWKLYINNVGSYSSDDLVRFTAKNHHARLPNEMEYLSSEFFNKVVSLIKNKYEINHYISDAFLRYQSSDADKTQLLIDYRKISKMGHNITIDWDLSAIHFEHLPYTAIKEFLRNDDKVHSQYEHFLNLIETNKDTETAELILIDGRNTYEYPYDLFKLFDFNKKIEILDKSGEGRLNINKIISKNEHKDFIRVALTNETLSGYISELPVKHLNENIPVAFVTARVLDTQLNIPLNEKIINSLSKENAKRIIAKANITEQNAYNNGDIALKQKLYNKLNRDELIEILGSFNEIKDFTALAALIDFMTPDEIVHACDTSPKFLRMYADRAPISYLAKFKNKAKFKEVVGDRRNWKNDNFGKVLESKLAQIK